MTMLGVVRLSAQRSVITEAVMTGCSDDVLCRVERTEFDDGSTLNLSVAIGSFECAYCDKSPIYAVGQRMSGFAKMRRKHQGQQR